MIFKIASASKTMDSIFRTHRKIGPPFGEWWSNRFLDQRPIAFLASSLTMVQFTFPHHRVLTVKETASEMPSENLYFIVRRVNNFHKLSLSHSFRFLFFRFLQFQTTFGMKVRDKTYISKIGSFRRARIPIGSQRPYMQSQGRFFLRITLYVLQTFLSPLFFNV